MNIRLLSRLAASAIFIFTLNACDGGTSPSVGEVFDKVAQYETGFSTTRPYNVNAQITDNTVVVTGMQQHGTNWPDDQFDQSEYFTVSTLNGATEIHTLPSPMRNIELTRIDSGEILMFGDSSEHQFHSLEQGTGRILASYSAQSGASFKHRSFVDIPGPEILFINLHREDNGITETMTARARYFNVHTGQLRTSNASLHLDNTTWHFEKMISLPDGRIMIIHRPGNSERSETSQMDIFDPVLDQYIDAADPEDMPGYVSVRPKVDLVNNTVCINSYYQYDVTSDSWTEGGCYVKFLTNDGINFSHPDHDVNATLFPGSLTYVTVEHDGNNNIETIGTYAGTTETGQIAVVTSGIEDSIRDDDCRCYPLISAGHLVLLQ